MAADENRSRALVTANHRAVTKRGAAPLCAQPAPADSASASALESPADASLKIMYHETPILISSPTARIACALASSCSTPDEYRRSSTYDEFCTLSIRHTPAWNADIRGRAALRLCIAPLLGRLCSPFGAAGSNCRVGQSSKLSLPSSAWSSPPPALRRMLCGGGYRARRVRRPPAVVVGRCTGDFPFSFCIALDFTEIYNKTDMITPPTGGGGEKPSRSGKDAAVGEAVNDVRRLIESPPEADGARGPLGHLSSAKNRPITDTDVQSDGRPLALPRHSHGAHHLRAAVAAA
eukprot:scaffold14600_cov110-Isochrysis_galbana.AAC.3